MNFLSEWQCFSYLRSGVDLILAGIHTEVKSLFGEKLFLSQFTKIHKKENVFNFCIIHFLKAIVFIELYKYLQVLFCHLN